MDAAPSEMRLSNASAWYTKPAHPGMLTATSDPIHVGRTTAVVSTTLRSAKGGVVSVTTQHVLRGMGLANLGKSNAAIAELAEKGMTPD